MMASKYMERSYVINCKIKVITVEIWYSGETFVIKLVTYENIGDYKGVISLQKKA